MPQVLCPVQSWPASAAQRRAAFLTEIARCDDRFQAAKARGDEPAAFYWSMQRAAAVRLLEAGAIPTRSLELFQ